MPAVLTPDCPTYEQYDPYRNYQAVIFYPSLVVAGKVRTDDGRWAVCHPPNGVNLHAYGVRWWIDRDEWASLDALWLDDLSWVTPVDL